MAINPMQYEPIPVSSSQNIIGLNSPFYANLTNPTTSSFTHIRLKLWYWKDGLYNPFINEDEPNVILYNEKISSNDDSILFELSDYLKGTFNPKFQYDSSGIPTSSDSSIFFKYEYDIINNPYASSSISASSVISSPTYLGTQGYNWGYVDSSIYNIPYNEYSFGFTESNVVKKYGTGVRYSTSSFDADALNVTSSIIINNFTPPSLNTICVKEPIAIVYINRLGLWDYFSPSGKVSFNNKIEKEKYTQTYRRPDLFNPSLDHRISQYNNNITSEIIINTGLIHESSGQYIEEIIYSPKVYLIQFKTNTNIGGFYNNYRQIPVIVTDTDFGRKTRFNDKGKISYNIKFEETINKIRNVR